MVSMKKRSQRPLIHVHNGIGDQNADVRNGDMTLRFRESMLPGKNL